MNLSDEVPIQRDRLVRRVLVPGTYNVRDIGGYELRNGSWIRPGMIFRGDALHRVGPEGRVVLKDLAIRSVIDLRGDAERARQPDALGGLDVRLVELPIFSPTELTRQSRPLREIYLDTLYERPAALVGALRELARPGSLPAFVHCRVGKDRTGMVIALLMSFLGASEDDIVFDFQASADALQGRFLNDLLDEHQGRGLAIEETMSLLAAERFDIDVFLEHLRTRARTIDEFLAKHGMSDDEMTALRDALTIENLEP